MSSSDKWHHDFSNMLALATWLDSYDCFGSPSDVVYFMEKPSKWEDEWDVYQAVKSLSVAEQLKAIEEAGI